MFKKIKYPDGQISVINDYSFDMAQIKERINSYEDLIYIRSIADTINTKNCSLYIPYMFGGRSDRRFSHNQSFDLKIIAQIINSCNFRRVEIFDPHSDVTCALIENSVAISPKHYVREAYKDVLKKGNAISLVSPDAGAFKKVFKIAEELDAPVIGVNKYRSFEGEISFSSTANISGESLLIVDDICDGGATFVKLGTILRELGAKNIYLYISHGIFSKGIMPFMGIIDHIYCTNSVKDITDSMITQYKII